MRRFDQTDYGLGSGGDGVSWKILMMNREQGKEKSGIAAKLNPSFREEIALKTQHNHGS